MCWKEGDLCNQGPLRQAGCEVVCFNSILIYGGSIVSLKTVAERTSMSGPKATATGGNRPVQHIITVHTPYVLTRQKEAF